MRAGLAFGAGVIGAAVMVLGLWLARALGATDFNFGQFWGSMFTGTTTSGSWILGVVITLILGGLIALIYAAFLEAVGRSNWGLGLLGGAIHLILAGLLIGWISTVHPAIPQAISNPGYFTANYGPESIAAFSIVHLLYGMIVGGRYQPVHKKLVRRDTLTAEERAAIEAGRDQYGREEVHVPTAPEDRLAGERPVKVGKGRRM